MKKPDNQSGHAEPLRSIGQSERIFGRNREITELRHLLISERLVLLHSPSGAGKTSLLNAGIIPEFAATFAVCPPTRVNFVMPGVYDERIICSTQIGGSPNPDESLEDVPLQDFIAGLPKDKNKLLILDHFESTVRAALANPGWHTGFFRQLGQLLEDPSIWALISLREDFVAPILPLLDYIPTRLRARYRLGFLSRSQAFWAMCDIAGTSGSRQFDRSAAARLVETLCQANVQNPDGTFTLTLGDAVEPLLLQVVCRRVWDGMPDDDLSIEPVDIEKFGDVNAALGAYYDDSVARQDPHSQRAIREWFEKHLITPGGIRGQVRRGHAHSEGLENAVIEQLLETHLVRAELRGTVTWYELAHDSLVAPVLASNTRWFQANLSPFQRRAATWLANDKAETFLLTGESLTEAELWQKANFFLATTDENEFLEKSQQRQAAMDREAELLRRLVHTTVNAELERANTAPNPGAALAHLAYALRVQPDSLVVRARIFDFLQRSRWSLPLGPLDTPEPLPANELSPNGSYRFTLAPGSAPVLHDLSLSPPVSNILEQSPPPTHAVFSPDSTRLITFTSNGEGPAILWNTATAKSVGNPIPQICNAAFSPDGSRFITYSEDATAQLWYASTASRLGPPLNHPAPPPDSPNALLLFEALSNDQPAPESPGLLSVQREHIMASRRRTPAETVPLLGHFFHPHNGKLLTVGADSSVRISNFAKSSFSQEYLEKALEPFVSIQNGIAELFVTVNTIDFAPLLSCSCPGHHVAWSPNGFTIAFEKAVLPVMAVIRVDMPIICDSNVNVLAFSPDGARRLTAHSDGTVLITPGPAPLVHPASVTQAQWSPDGTQILTVDSANAIRLWDSTTGLQILELLAQPGPVSLHPNGAQLLINAAFWDISTNQQIHEYPHKDTVQFSGFSPDGSRVYIAEASALLTVWTANGPLAIPHKAQIMAVEFCSDSLALLTLTADNEVQVWCAQTGARIGQVMVPRSKAHAAHFNPDGSFVLTLSENGLVQLWDALTGLPAAMPFYYPGEVRAAAFNPESTLLLTAGPDSPAHLRAIYKNTEPELLAQLAEAVGGQTLNVHDAVIPLHDQAAALRAIPRDLDWIRRFLPE